MKKMLKNKSGSIVNYLLLGLLIASVVAVAVIPYFFPSPGQMTAMVTTRK